MPALHDAIRWCLLSGTSRTLAAEWEPRFTSTVYDPRLVPAGEKGGALCGMAMTEKQGGSDVRANTTQARPIGRRPGRTS